MPNWDFHNKWAYRMGMVEEASRLVNVHEDRIWRGKEDKYPNTLKFTWKGEEIPNTKGRFNFMRQCGSKYVKTWILHIILDEIEDNSIEYLDIDTNTEYFSLEKAKDSVEHISMQIENCNELDFVKGFVLENLEDILQNIVKILNQWLFD